MTLEIKDVPEDSLVSLELCVPVDKSVVVLGRSARRPNFMVVELPDGKRQEWHQCTPVYLNDGNIFL